MLENLFSKNNKKKLLSIVKYLSLVVFVSYVGSALIRHGIDNIKTDDIIVLFFISHFMYFAGKELVGLRDYFVIEHNEKVEYAKNAFKNLNKNDDGKK